MISLRCSGLSFMRRCGVRSISLPSFKGRATISGTYEFIQKSKLPLHHEFAVSKLTINPIIHGAPKNYSISGKNTQYMEALTRRAIVKNRSNCVVVYQYHENDNSWYSTNLDKLFLDPLNDVKRENIVAVAHLGYATTREDILNRLYNACKFTRLEYIDMVLFEVTENTSQFMLDETMMTLQELSRNDKLQSFGIQVSVAPYVYHNPPLNLTGPLQTLPMYIENFYVDKFKYADMVIYPISPTTAIPTTYPMLEPNEGEEVEEPALGENEEPLKKSDEATRKFTRIAIHPLTCKLGGKETFKYENPAIWEARAELEAQEEEAAALQEGGQSEDGETDSSDEEEEEGEEVEEEEVEVKQKVISPEKLKLLKELQRMDPSFTIEDLDSDSDSDAEGDGGGRTGGKVPKEKSELEIAAELINAAADGTIQHKNAKVSPSKSKTKTSGGQVEDSDSEDDVQDDGVEERELVEVDLMNSLHELPFEQIMIEALDEVCPPLRTTPLLEDKALRVVMSVGIDCVLVDAERSAMLGKLRLRPADKLTSSQTEDVFSRFCLPNPFDSD